MQASILIVAAAGLLAACGAPEPAGNEAAPAADQAAPAVVPAGAPRSERQAASEIPPAFRGVYDSSLAACSRPSENRLTVSAGELRFHESIGTIREVTVLGPGEVRVASDFQGEGESWRAAHQLRLADGGATLTVAGEGTSFTRIRCTGSAPVSARETLYWGTQGSSGIVLSGADGRLRLTLSCRLGSGELIVNVPAFRPVGSEERMTFGAGGIAVALVADSRGDARRGGVTGRGPVPAELAAILAADEGIAVNYGSQTIGPHSGVPAQHARYLVESCGG
jgi:hypothetical protein